MEKGTPKSVVAIVQARMGSTRLPGKSMMLLGGKPIIELVLSRVGRARSLAKVVLATSERSENDVLCDVAARLGVSVFRGPENDVLKRYLLAAQAFGAGVVVRVCADNPLIAPEEVDRVVEHHRRTGADYSFNHRPRLDNSYPDGLGAEVLDFEVLRSIEARAVQPAHREHVTTYIWDNLGQFHVEAVQAPESIAGPDVKLDVDTAEDFRRLQALVSALPPRADASWSAWEIVAAYRACFAAA